MKCELCHGQLSPSAKYGVCTRSVECAAENNRRSVRACVARNPTPKRRYEKTRGRERHRREKHDELTYLTYSPGLDLYKIGKSTNIVHRMSSLCNGCPDLELITTFPYGGELEEWLHDHFAAHRVYRTYPTDWFKGITAEEVKNAVISWETDNALP